MKLYFSTIIIFHTFSSYKGWKYHEFKTIFRKWSFEYNKRGKRNCFSYTQIEMILLIYPF